MATTKLTDPRIVEYARKGFAYYTAQGDAPPSALNKAISNALAKLWRKRPLDMNDPRNAARYGEQFAELKRLVAPLCAIH